MTLIPEIVVDATAVAGQRLQFDYDLVLVAVSYLLAALASFVTLRLIGHLRTTADSRRQRNLIGLAGLCLGAGIWGMHFVGMLACTFPVEVSYDPGLTMLSLAIPIVVCGFGVFWIRVPAVSTLRLAASGTVTGLGIALMHYVGMAAMRASVHMVYRADLFAASIVIGIVAAVAAFWVGRHFSTQQSGPSLRTGILTSAIMAVAISGMHYTGMAALIVIDEPDLTLSSAFAIEPGIIATAIALMLVLILSAAQLALTLGKDTTGRTRLALMPVLMAAVAAGSVGTAVAVLYDTAQRLERNELLDVARVNRDFIDSVARFDARYSGSDVLGGAPAATLGQIREAHGQFEGYGKSGEFYLAHADNGAIEYVVPLRFAPDGAAPRIAYGGTLDRPMQLALRGRTGTTVGPDYRGERVLAAYTPVTTLGLGLVIKIDMQEIRAPFVTAGLLAAAATLVLIAVGVAVSTRISSPVVHELDEKARIDVELEFAKAVQQGLLPDAPPQRAPMQFAARTLPARFVSGDFYDFIEIGDDYVAMILGDVSGKGISAALLMVQLLSDVRYAFARERDPARVLAELNGTVLANTRQGMFATACCLLLDVPQRQLHIASAGHLPITLRLGSGRILEIGHPSGPPLGVVDTPGYVREQHTLGVDDLIVAYTDGVIEPRNAQGDAYGVARMHDVIAANASEPGSLIDAMHQAIDTFTGNAPPMDDLTVLVLRVAGETS